MTGKQAKIVKTAARRAYREGRFECFWGWKALRVPFLPGLHRPGTYAEQMGALGERA